MNNNTKKEFLDSLLDFWNEKEPEAISWTDLQSKTFLCKRNKYPQSIHIYCDNKLEVAIGRSIIHTSNVYETRLTDELFWNKQEVFENLYSYISAISNASQELTIKFDRLIKNEVSK